MTACFDDEVGLVGLDREAMTACLGDEVGLVGLDREVAR
jgi:hypothetical protein